MRAAQPANHRSAEPVGNSEGQTGASSKDVDGRLATDATANDAPADEDADDGAAADGTASEAHARGVRAWLERVIYYRPLMWLSLAVILGVKLQTSMGALAELSPLAWLSALVVALAIALPLHGRGYALTAGAMALLAALAFGGFHGQLQTPPAGDSLAGLATRKAEPIALRGLIASAAVWKPNPNYRSGDPHSEAWQTQWDVRCEQMRDGQQWRDIAALSTLTVVGRIDDLLPGDRVEIMGSFRRISAPTNPGGFDFAEHFRHEGKFVSLTAKSRKQVTVLAATQHMQLPRLRGWLVKHVDRSLHRWISPAQSPLAAALVFGQREQVDWADQQSLMATGTLHMLAISGMHVEIVAASILLLAGPFGWPTGRLMLLIVSVCVAYAILAGGNPPVLRAIIVVAAFSLARVLGRPARLANVLGLAALTLVLLRAANVDSVGVQLSFLAVGTIGLFAFSQTPARERRGPLVQLIDEGLGPAQRWLRWWLRSLRQTWRLSLWVWLITCPLVWYSFHIVAPISVPLNVVIALPLVLALISGLITGLFGWLPPLGWLAGNVCTACLSIIRTVVRFGENIPLGHLWLPAPSVGWMLFFYLILAVWLLRFQQRRNTALLAVLVGWIAVGIAPYSFGPRGWWGGAASSAEQLRADKGAASELRCTFLDVGHGTSVMIEMPHGEVWLYDAGHMGSSDRSHQDIAAGLWHIPTTRIERLLISHADSDHYNATAGLLQRFAVAKLASTEQFYMSTDRNVRELLQRLPNSLQREALQSGDGGQVGEVTYQILHPGAGLRAESDNAASLCLLLEFAGKRLLLPGDLEGSGLADLTQLPPRPCHVLMAPHHGSLTLDPSELLAWCRPEWVIVSGNHRALRAEVLEKYSFAGSRLGITFRDGAVQVRVDRHGSLSVWHWRSDQWQLLEL